MLRHFRRLVGGAGTLAALLTSDASAQTSPYVALDDPRLPLLEHLIGRGVIEDPSPMVRPFRASAAVRVLAAADTSAEHPDAALLRSLRTSLARPAGNRWALEARAGGQAYSHARRDVLHPAGPAGVRPYGAFRGEATIGGVTLVTRPLAEPRLVDDPDWPGRRTLKLIWRLADAYLNAEWKWGSLFYGQMDRNLGPVGHYGIGISNYGYAREALALEIGTRDLRLFAQAADLRDAQDATGATIHRYFFMHRIEARVSSRLRLAAWETTVLAGPDRKFDGRYRNPVTLLVLANQYGQGDAGANVLIGLDVSWRAWQRTTLQAQFGLDDIQYKRRTGAARYPNRWALTLSAQGPLASRFAWRALYTQASSLAFRTLDPFQNLTDAGVGLGRNFADMDQLSATVSTPIGTGWLVTPEITLLRQGEGRLADPFPQSAEEAGQIPQLFIGTVERTWRAAIGVTGRQGPFDVSANAGFHRVVNAGHIEGRTVNRFEGRLQATMGFTTGGTLR